MKKCPTCKTNDSVSAYAPFCSKACKNIDWLCWVNGVYVVPTDEMPFPSQENNEDE